MVNFHSYLCYVLSSGLVIAQNGQVFIQSQKNWSKTQVVVMRLPSLASGEMLSQFAGSTVDFSNILDNHWLVVDLPLWKIWVRQLGLLFPTGSVSKPCSPVVHIKIAGKWMFIPIKNGINRYWSIPIWINMSNKTIRIPSRAMAFWLCFFPSPPAPSFHRSTICRASSAWNRDPKSQRKGKDGLEPFNGNINMIKYGF